MCNITVDQKRRILLVEGDDAYRYALSRELEVAGLTVIECRLAMEALDHLDRDPTIRKAVIDIRMPANTLTGLGLARMMRHRNRDARVVLMTALPDYLDIGERERFGEVLLKTPDAGGMAMRICERLGLPADHPQPSRSPTP